MPRFTAMERAATLLRDPVCVARMRTEPLPDDVVMLLRILAGDAEAEAEAVAALGKPAATMREAAEFYVIQVLFHSTSDPYRLLGVGPDASRADVRANLALLLRWLHPDIAGPKHRGMTERAIKAWTDLKAPEARKAIDQDLVKNREAIREKRLELVRRLGPKRPPDGNRARHESSMAKPRHARPQKSRRKLAMTVVCLAAMIGYGAIYFPSETFSDASQFFVSLYQSMEPSSSPPPEAPAQDEVAATTHSPDAKSRDVASPCASCSQVSRRAKVSQ